MYDSKPFSVAHWLRSYCYQFFNTTEPREYAFLRKRVAGAYSMSSILSLKAQLQEIATGTRHARLASYFAFDVVDATDIKSIIQSIHAGSYQMANLGYVPGQMKWINNFITQLILKFMSRGEPNSFDDFRPEGSGRTPDMLDHFIAMLEPDGSKATIGSDDYLRVRGEVDQAYAQGFDSPGGSVIPYLVAEKLPYLNACVKEGLRLHPSILWQLPREAPKNGVEIARHYIPSSATIIFDADADEWKPSRWIISKEVTEMEVREMDKYNVTFGYGSRTGIGRNLALVEIFKLIANFVRRYEAKFTNELNPFNIKSQWFSVQKDMYITLKMRQKSVE
ncbi:cytochrome P450 [Dactylonectria macrodidyma]|uniref:Cytochrome P450 n=1 Tax=Dactylonectria macrodidyma TaxID=307937 RepID=A0A9P9JK94_9HYPO|nr:cytochrome P450 [Dactylonectria macrodidyma]